MWLPVLSSSPPLLVLSLGILTTTQGLRLDFGLPGGTKVSYRDGLLRIQPPQPAQSPTGSGGPLLDPEGLEVPWDTTVGFSSNRWDDAPTIEHRATASKGYGAFYAGTEPLAGGTFLGCYEGELIDSREALDALHARRRKEFLDHGSGEDAEKVGDYVLSLDGGAHFLDGFDLRYQGNTADGRRQRFTPAHLNHANKNDSACNVVRKLVYIPSDLGFETDPGGSSSVGPPLWLCYEDYPESLPRVAFFAGREILPGEELAFDYGTNFWKSNESPLSSD